MSFPSYTTSSSPRTGASRGKPPIFSIVFLLAFPVLFLGIMLYQKLQGPAAGDGLRAPDRRSDFALDMPTLDGGRWQAADHIGKVLIVNSFATWCEPCREEMPDLVKIAQQYASRGVDVAAIGLDDDAESDVGRIAVLNRYAQSQHLPFPILIPKSSHRADLIPRTYVIDRHGRLACFMFGRFDDKRMRTLLDDLLKEP